MDFIEGLEIRDIKVDVEFGYDAAEMPTMHCPGNRESISINGVWIAETEKKHDIYTLFEDDPLKSELVDLIFDSIDQHFKDSRES